MKKIYFHLIVMLVALASCVGTDELDDSDLLPTVNVDDMDSSDFNMTRTGVFSGNASYDVKGSVSLYYDDKDDLQLELSNDFEVSSFGAAIYIYLSNTSEGVAGGQEIVQLTKQGGQTFNVSAVNSELSINSYDYVIVHCKPFNIPFGQSSKLTQQQ